MLHTLVVLMTTIATPADTPAVEIVGHRGASFDAPENTVASVKLAWEQKADAAEFDVYLSKDGKIVVIHDATTKRTAGVDRKVAELTAAELRKLDVGKWKNAKFAGEPVPTLDEVLATVPVGKRVFIEVKCGPEIVPELDRVLKASTLKPEQTAVIAFSADVIAAAKKARPDLQAYWVVSLAPKNQKPRTAEELAEAVVHEQQLAIQRDERHADGRVREQRREQRTALAELQLGAPGADLTRVVELRAQFGHLGGEPCVLLLESGEALLDRGFCLLPHARSFPT